MNLDITTAHITGTMVAYYFICHRKLWLFAKGLNMENISGNADVMKGKSLHEERFKRETQKEMQFGQFTVDFLKYGDKVYVHEIKKSKKFEEAHMWQLKFYIYRLQLMGINCDAGVIHYPLSMRKVDVQVTEEDQELLRKSLGDMEQVLQCAVPPARLNKKVCKRCAYFDFCMA